ncbi:MAG: ATP-binding protein [Myxococcota bacterium]|nr:ATP-binding protein [Myxococcota bacterium]
MADRNIQIERAQNLWSSFARSVELIARASQITPAPELGFERIGGLPAAKDEILSYACAATSPEVYSNWGTFPPSGLLLIGIPSTGKGLLAQALATQTGTSFLRVDVPRLALDVVHAGGKVGELVQQWSQTLEEMPRLTVFFDELEFSQAHDLGGPRTDLPVGPIMDFLLELIDRTIACEGHLVVGSTGFPDTLRHAFARPGRLERIVEVTPSYPDDIIAALAIHAADAEARAGRPLFDNVDWKQVVGQSQEGGTGDWIRLLHGVLRHKARIEASGEDATPITTLDLDGEVGRFAQAQRRIRVSGGGNYV